MNLIQSNDFTIYIKLKHNNNIQCILSLANEFKLLPKVKHSSTFLIPSIERQFSSFFIIQFASIQVFNSLQFDDKFNRVNRPLVLQIKNTKNALKYVY